MSTHDATYLAESRVPQIIAGSLIPAFVSTIFVLARLYSRGIIIRNWGADDSWLTGAAILGWAVTIINCEMTAFGTGRHVELEQPGDIKPTLNLAFVARLVYQLALSATKIAICTSYLRIFQDRTSKYIVYLLLGFIVVATIVLEIWTIRRCNPGGDMRSTSCAIYSGQLAIVYCTGAFNILSDVLLLAFVFPRVVVLKMAHRQKFILLGIMSLSLLVILAAILRMVLTKKGSQGTDVTWDSSAVVIWSSIELQIGLFCSAAPGVKPLLSKCVPGFLSSSNFTHGTESGTATATQRRTTASQGFELRSQNETHFGEMDPRNAILTNKFWLGDDIARGEKGAFDGGDRDSETGILGSEEDGPNSATGGIRKTVTVMVTGQRERELGEGGIEENRSPKKFEHV